MQKSVSGVPAYSSHSAAESSGLSVGCESKPSTPSKKKNCSALLSVSVDMNEKMARTPDACACVYSAYAPKTSLYLAASFTVRSQ